MRSRHIIKAGNPRLILIFAGWGTDWRPFGDLYVPGYDIAVVWDYKELTFSWKSFLRYDEICLVAWSFGVFVASTTIHEIEPRITLRVAVNGTLTPLDEYCGTSPSTWRRLENTLSPSVWRRFLQSCCGSAEQFEWLCDRMPRRTLADIREELKALETHTIFHVEQIDAWDIAVVGAHDSLFPVASQLNAWRGRATVRVIDSGHLPDFGELLTALTVDKKRVAEVYGRPREEGAEDALAVVNRRVASTLMDRFDAVFGSAPVIGNVIEVSGGGQAMTLSRWFPRTDPRARLLMWNITGPVVEMPRSLVFEQCDAEVRVKRHPSRSAGFIFTAMALQWHNSPRDFLLECERVLVPGGYLAVAVPVAPARPEGTVMRPADCRLLSARNWRRIIPRTFDVLAFDETVESLETRRGPSTLRPLYIIARKAETQ